MLSIYTGRVQMLLLMSLCLCLGVGAAVSAAAPSSEAGDFVVICPIDGDILDSVSVVVERAVKKEAVGAKAILFIVDTYGGRVDSAIDITNTILASKVPTIAFVTGKGAISAGALISYACDYIVMAPGTNIGASTPISPGVEMTEEMNEKSMSFLRARYRALGEEKGHNPLIGEAMVDASIELYGAHEGAAHYRVYKVEKGKVSESYAVDGDAPVLKEIPSLSAGMGSTAQLDEKPAPRSLQEIIDLLTEQSGQPKQAPAPEPKREAAATEPIPAEAEPIKDIEGLPADARLISPAGKLLTLTTREAREVGLIRVSEDTPEKVLNALGFGGYRNIYMTMTWAEMIFAFLTSPLISGLLLMGAIGGIYLEFKTPGFGLPGIVGITCLCLYFGSRLVFGIADWIDVLLVVTGFVLLIAEIFFIPGFGVTGITGILCLIAGIYLSLTRVPIPQYTWDYVRLRDAGVTVTLFSCMTILFMFFMWKLFPRTALAHSLILSSTQNTAAGYTVQGALESRAVGLRGRATTMLRPAGKGRFDTITYDVVTRGEFIDADTPIEIIEVEGNRYVVQESGEET